jgi:hypothetical protein
VARRVVHERLHFFIQSPDRLLIDHVVSFVRRLRRTAGRNDTAAAVVTVSGLLAAIGLAIVSLTGCRDYPPAVAAPNYRATNIILSKQTNEGRRIENLGAATKSVGAYHDGAFKFGDVQYHADFGNTGTILSFTAFVTAYRDYTISPVSAARIIERGIGNPRFLSLADARNWRRSGAPRLSVRFDGLFVSPGSFGFAPQGVPLTFADITRMPSSPRTLQRLVVSRLDWSMSSYPPASLILRQYGFLLATAPLLPSARSGIAAAVSLLPGVHICSPSADRLDRPGVSLCVEDRYGVTEILVRIKHPVVLAINERTSTTSTLYPGLKQGSLIQQDAFIH